MQPIHKHLLIFAKVNKFPNEKEEKVVTDFMEKLVEKIDMKLIAGPIAKYVSDQGNIGWTSALLLSTSHAAMHIWNEWGIMQLHIQENVGLYATQVSTKVESFKFTISKKEKF